MKRTVKEAGARSGTIKVSPEKSDRQLAKDTGLSQPFLGKEPSKMEESGDVKTLSRRTDSLGREQQAHKPPSKPTPSAVGIPAADPPAREPEPRASARSRQQEVKVLLADIRGIIENYPAHKFERVLPEHERGAVDATAEEIAMWTSAVAAIVGTDEHDGDAEDFPVPISEPPSIPNKHIPVSALETMLDYIGKFQGSAGELIDWWRSKHAERAAMAPPDQDSVGKSCNEKLGQIVEI